ncbi:hypothetical protein H310_14109 [Aphanomyces invadans]|uniref:PH domain-containing protein n=1 Tax=Aphanomyces invadans TaxID=157072 RepID=A0A024TAT3_9STRA|nr:hypothetical protein H310_14109 [Aphanomyces invadans]ETV91255.1 hypothetical protein H310_14109 [Aphanomyces invadans]|eukprot:XP_008880092.1 hypothetical protein H310_14109 [Aphanomyces invadans]
MMEAEAAAEEDQAHGSGNGYLWILPSPPQPVAGDDDDDETQQPQRFWFEVTSFCLQWRLAPRSEQHTVNRIAFSDVAQVAPLSSTNLRITTLTSTLVLKAPTRDVRNMWLQSLGDAIFCSGRPPAASPVVLLHECMDNNDIEYLKHLLSTNSSLITSADDEGNSLLLQACKRNASVEVHQTLLQYGVDPHSLNWE